MRMIYDLKHVEPRTETGFIGKRGPGVFPMHKATELSKLDVVLYNHLVEVFGRKRESQ